MLPQKFRRVYVSIKGISKNSASSLVFKANPQWSFRESLDNPGDFSKQGLRLMSLLGRRFLNRVSSRPSCDLHYAELTNTYPRSNLQLCIAPQSSGEKSSSYCIIVSKHHAPFILHRKRLLLPLRLKPNPMSETSIYSGRNDHCCPGLYMDIV